MVMTSSAYSRGSPSRVGNGTDAPSESCAACDDCVRPEERTTCRASGATVCPDCAATCGDCEGDFLPESTDRCEKCDELDEIAFLEERPDLLDEWEAWPVSNNLEDPDDLERSVYDGYDTV